MSYAINPVRPGLTAIAAVLALSSTPSFAQTVDPAAPMVTPPPVVSTPSATTTGPAPTVQSSSADTTAPASGLVTVPIRPGTSSMMSNATPAPVTSAPEPAEAGPAPVARPASVSRTARTTTVRSTDATASAPAAMTQVPAAAAPAASEKLAPVAPMVAPAPAPAAQATTARSTTARDDTLPIAGGVGAAILLLGGGLFALNRRRREDAEPVYGVETVETPVAPIAPPITAREVHAAPAATAPVPTAPIAGAPAATAFVEPPLAEPARAMQTALVDAPANPIPAGFDTSRFGRHVQQAYRGPTPDNPFLSLKRRIKRASFYDMRERMAAQGDLSMTGPATAPTAQATAAAPRHAEFVTTRVQRPPRPGFRPAYQG